MQPLLPPEIWALILVDHCDSATVDAVSQVNATFQQLVTENRALNDRRYIQYLPDGLIASPLDPELLERAGGYQALLEGLYHQQQLRSDLAINEPYLRRYCALESACYKHQQECTEQSINGRDGFCISFIPLVFALICLAPLEGHAAWISRKLSRWCDAVFGVFFSLCYVYIMGTAIAAYKKSFDAQAEIRNIEAEKSQLRRNLQPFFHSLGERLETVTRVDSIAGQTTLRELVELDPIRSSPNFPVKSQPAIFLEIAPSSSLGHPYSSRIWRRTVKS